MQTVLAVVFDMIKSLKCSICSFLFFLQFQLVCEITVYAAARIHIMPVLGNNS